MIDKVDGSGRRYRPDIDGLRAVAVLGVLSYHLGIGFVPGGFAGVDVFFVISGFLITQLIRDEIKATGRFDLSRFYLRRIRRLFPALILTIIFVLFWAIILFSPDHLRRLGGAAFHGLVSLSNIFFWAESGYFDADSRFKPLLHTWSLGVEAQFYLIWPALLFWTYRAFGERWAFVFVLLGLAVSLFLNHVFVDGQSALLSSLAPDQAGWFSDGRATIFYLLPFRVFEFAIGAGLVWVVEGLVKTAALLSDLLMLSGIGLILYTFANASSAAPWPHFGAIWPCVGTAMVIAASGSRLSRLVLSNPVLVPIGLISYSLYLVHWPIIVFVQYVRPEPLTPGIQILLGTISVVLAAVVYHVVERPYRRPRSIRALSASGFSGVCAFLALIVALPSANMWATHGWAWRRDALISEAEVEAYKSGRFVETVNACRLDDVAEGRNLRRADGELRCRMDAELQIVVMGDSHAVDSLNTFTELYRDRPDRNLIYALKDGGDDVCVFRADNTGHIVHDLNRTGCSDRAAILNSDVWKKIDILVLDVFEDQERHYAIAAAIAARHPELKLVIMSPYIGTRPYNCSDLANRYKTFEACKNERFVTVFGADRNSDALLPVDRFVFIDRREFFCSEDLELGSCLTTVGAAPVFVDGDHLTLEASRFIAHQLSSDGADGLIAIGLPP